MKTLVEAEEEIAWELGSDIVPKFLGDDMFMLPGLSDSRAEALSLEEAQHGSTQFHTLEKWNPNMKTGHKLIWVQCWGIPLVAWDTEQFRKIAAVIGDLVELDDDAEEFRRLDRVRMLNRTPWKPLLQHTIHLHIAGEQHTIYFVEEIGPDTLTCNCKTRHLDGSSDKIESEDNDTGNPLGAANNDHAPSDNIWNITDEGDEAGDNGHLLLPSGTSYDPLGNNFGRRPDNIVVEVGAIDMEAGKGKAPVTQDTLGSGLVYTNKEKEKRQWIHPGGA